MAERTRPSLTRLTPRTAEAATGFRHQLSWLWGRESILRLALSLVLSVALWLYLTDKQNPNFVDLAQPIPVAASFVGPNFTVLNNLGFVHVRYRAENPNQYVSASSFQASVNLVNKTAGTFRVPIEVTANPGINVVSYSPRKVTAVVDRTLHKLVKVVPHYLVTSPPNGYEAGTPSYDPTTVTVSGPESIVSQVSEAAVDIDLSNQRAGILALSRPIPVDSRGNPVSGTSYLSVSPSYVRVSVPIRTITSYKSLPVLVPIHGHPRAGYGVVGVGVDPPEITAKGSPSALSKLTTASTVPISVSHLGRGQIRRKLKLDLPKHVSSTTKTVTATITLRTVDASSSIEIGVQPNNVIPGLVAHIRPSDVLVTVVGPYSSLGKAAGGVTAGVDLSGLGVGVYRLTPTVVAPHGFVTSNVVPQAVTVVVETAPIG